MHILTDFKNLLKFVSFVTNFTTVSYEFSKNSHHWFNNHMLLQSLKSIRQI